MFTNVLNMNTISMINLDTGVSVKDWEFMGLENGQDTGILNGISYVKSRDSFLLTGKHFDRIFEVKLDY